MHEGDRDRAATLGHQNILSIHLRTDLELDHRPIYALRKGDALHRFDLPDGIAQRWRAERCVPARGLGACKAFHDLAT